MEQYTYAVSRIHAREVYLLTASDLKELSKSADYASALRVLKDKGYGNGGEYNSFETLEDAETERLWEFIDEVVPDRDRFKVLLVGNDFHNLKAAIKAIYTSEDPDSCFMPGGLTDPELIAEAVRLKRYGDLPVYLSRAALSASESFLKSGNGQDCDIIIDRICLETMIEMAEESGSDMILEYAELYAALCNIKIALRAARAGKSKAFLSAALARGGKIDPAALAGAASRGEEELLKYLEHTDFRALAEAYRSSFAEFEKCSDGMIMELIRRQRHNPFTIGPVFAYIIAKQNEITAVRIIMTGLKNKLDMDMVMGLVCN